MSNKKKVQIGCEQADCEELLVRGSRIFCGASAASGWWGHTHDLLKKATIFIQKLKGSIPVFPLPLRSSPWLQCSGRSYQGRRSPHALWLGWNGAVTSLPRSPLRSDTFVLSRRQKPINNVNDGSDLFGCPRKQQRRAIMHINCALLGWSHYRSY